MRQRRTTSTLIALLCFLLAGNLVQGCWDAERREALALRDAVIHAQHTLIRKLYRLQEVYQDRAALCVPETLVPPNDSATL